MSQCVSRRRASRYLAVAAMLGLAACGRRGDPRLPDGDPLYPVFGPYPPPPPPVQANSDDAAESGEAQ